ncbi:hypothetical protein GsuE55_20440 [Geobacillus subterraneus]|uniref:Uncharacterized protein n=1 Tax=Geobacillus subterraneus TaxID=129338 RepID=A0A679FZR0_9BACL|nr:hypothetical protein GsuE55_20440 [Geobacillus subterraneus]
MRKLVVAFLMHDGVYDVKKHFFIHLDRFRTNVTTKSADNLEHGITFFIRLKYHIELQFPLTV